MKSSARRFRNKYNIQTFILILLLCLLPVGISAEEELSLEQAVLMSLMNNTNYKISLEKVNESRLKVREAWGMLWPQLSTDVSYTRMWAEAGTYSRIKEQYNVKFINGELSVNPGAFYHTLQSSYKGHVAAENDVRTVKVDIIIKTIQLYYQMLLADESIELREDSIKALEENLRVVETGYKKGTFSRLDYLRAQVSLSNERTKLINARNNLLTAKASLNIHLGRDINEPLMLNRKALEVDIKSLPYKNNDVRIEEELVGKMIADALQNRPEFLQIKYEKESTEHMAKSVESVYLWPSFFISGDYGTSKTVPRDTGSSNVDPAYASLIEAINKNSNPEGWIKNWSITFGATYRWGALAPFDSTHAKASQMKSKVTQADLQMEEFIKQVKLDVQQKFLKLKSASNSIASQQGNIETAEESLRISTVQFRNGIIDNTKLLEANVELTTARTLYIEALHNYQVARAELNRAIGKDYFQIK